MSKKLLILTAGYPFGTGEPYLFDELTILATQYEQLLLFAVNVSGTEERPVPANCKVFPINHFQYSTFHSFLFFIRSMNWNALKKGFQHLRAHWWYAKCSCAVKATVLFEIGTPKDAVVYAYWSDYLALAAIQIAESGSGNVVIARAHGHDVYEERHAGGLPFRSYLSNHLHQWLFISKHGLSYTESKYPSANKKLAYLGVRERKRLAGRSDEVLKLYSNSACIPLKRIYLIIQALSELTIEYEWWHIGGGPLLESLQHEAKRNGLNTRFTGQITHEEVHNIIQRERFDVLLNVSETEGLPVSMMEAMSYGIPVVGTDVGGVSEIIDDHRNGLLLPVTPTVCAVAETVAYFAELSTPERTKLSKNAYDTWQVLFKAEKNYYAFVDELQ